MVLINGVKYACERCIRGHRVTTCTHTDQPLTMIKPKGRPAAQCQHCRDQRKLKNIHIQCSCAKKGKSPGQHLASCHKAGSCTCYQNHKLKTRAATPSGTAAGVTVAQPQPQGAASVANSGYIFEDIMLPFRPSSNGLFDLFATEDHSPTSPGRSSPLAQPQPVHHDEVEADHYFPLFPLVGTQSFDASESQPLSSLPAGFQSALARSHSSSLKNNRPASVLSLNSNSSISTDLSKVDPSAYPPSAYPLKQDVAQSSADLYNFNETNELNISNEDIESFLNEFDEAKDLVEIPNVATDVTAEL